MDEPGLRIELLRDPQVKAYFLHLLESPLSDEVKYQKFIDYCIEQVSPAELAAAALSSSLSLPNGGKEPARVKNGADMEDLLQQVFHSIRHATCRMRRSQHRDGGWGPRIEQSSYWHTVYNLLFLKSAQDILGLEYTLEIEAMLRSGAAYLEQHPEFWSPDTLPALGGMSVYDTSLMVRWFYRVGRSRLRRDVALRVYHGLDRLYHAQNEDGGWDATLWGAGVHTPTRVWSEVGATSSALQALAETLDTRFQPAVEKGMQWLAGTQNPDGSWNDGSCQAGLPAFQLAGEPSIGKTCAALLGLLAGEALDVPLRPYRGCITRAVDWLLRAQKPVLERQRRVLGWSWGFTSDDYDNTVQLLELLRRLPDVSPDSLASHIAWLVQSQRRQADDPEDGCWVLGPTARIGLLLADFYQQVRAAQQILPWVV